MEDKFKTLRATLLGDGYLTPKTIGKVSTFRFGMEHSLKQYDYLQFKAQMINKEMDRNCKTHKRKTREMAGYEVFCKKEFEKLRNQYYPNGKKCLMSILNDVTNPLYTLAIWLADDGGVHWDVRKERKNKDPRIIICACDQSVSQHNDMIDWFSKVFGLKPKMITQKNSKRNTQWNLLRFSTKDSLQIWYMIKKFIYNIPSMQYKFRILESELQKHLTKVEYNLSTSVRLQQLMLDENVCRTSWRHEETEDKKPLC